MSDKPVPESYWVVPGSFLAGAYPGSSHGEAGVTRLRLRAFLEAGFDTFFDLTRQGELPAYLPALQEEGEAYGIAIHHQRFEIQDRGLPAHERIVALLDAIDAALAGGSRVYAHCWGGVGRTGMAVGCWLARHGLTGQAALARLGELYRTSEQSHFFLRSPETDAQVRFILDWKG